MAATALRGRRGQFLVVGRDTRVDEKYDAAVWRVDATGRVARVAVADAALGGEFQQQMLAVADTPDGLIAAGQNGRGAGVWRSPDDGDHWARVSHPTLRGDADATLQILSIAVRDGDVVAVGFEADGQGNHARAAAWLARGGTDTWVRGSSPSFQPRGQRMRAVTVAPDGTFVAVGYDHNDVSPRPAVWTSSDGQRWTLRPGVPAGPGRYEMGAVTVTGSEVLSGGYGGPVRQADARIWSTNGLG
jgi:hypothetical protein